MAAIRRGLDAGEFFPVFQPIVELRTGRIAGFEVLARWQQPSGEIVAPDAFIGEVESAGMINDLTASILNQAFALGPIWQEPLRLSVNLSATQLLNPRLPERLEATARAGGFPLERLTLEITESALVDDLKKAREAAQALKAMHCRLALDDFGTGYSSLTHLHALPFDELKVDRSFVSSMADQRESREIVASVIGLGQSLGLTTVAEGVETPEHAEILFWIGCNLAQGWHYGRPVPASQLPAVIASSPLERPVALTAPGDRTIVESLQALPAYRLAQLQAIYDGAPVGLCFLDRNLRYVSLNQRLAELNGIPAAQHLGRTVADVLPAVFPKIEPLIRRALAGEPVDGVEIKKPGAGPDGEDQTLLPFYRAVYGTAGDIVGVSVAVMDISQYKQTEEALRESEDHFRHMIRLSPHVPWVLDATGAVTDASPRWEEITGQPMSEAMGHGWLMVVHPDDVPRTNEAIRQTLRKGLPIDIDYRIRQASGEWKWMRSRGAPRFSPAGQIVGVYGVVEEVDAPRPHPRELDVCEFELRTAMETVPIGLVLADGNDGTICLVNPSARETLKEGAFPGQRLTEYGLMGIHDLDGHVIPPEEHPLARAILHGETIESRHFRLQRDGLAPHRLSISSHPIHSDAGQLIGGIMMIRDLDAA
ncbi:MAG TPA: EAL domain-containing protein [Acidobacteriaceae bacterium]|nr:EAL domain-containing protein [Acidobacteriaceae bacterium]